MLQFKDEMLIPLINGEVYYAIYELENWLRGLKKRVRLELVSNYGIIA